jgi:site-specific DNA-methyltransferase (adenine-specific)
VVTILDSTVAEVEVLEMAEGRDTSDLNDKDDSTLIAEARWHAEQHEVHHQQSLWHAIECGRRIQVLHERLARRRGRPVAGEVDERPDFTSVVADEIGIGRSHAYNLMELARPENVQQVENLGEDASVRQALEAVHVQRREQRREQARAARQARLQFPPPVDLPGHLNLDVADAADLPLPDEMIDLIVTSPPYGLGMNYREADDNEGYDTYMLRAADWAREMYRVAGPLGRLCLNVPLDISYGHFHAIYADWLAVLQATGWLYRTTLVWNEDNVSRTTARGSVDSPNSPHAITRVEMIAVLYKGTWNLDRSSEQNDLTHDEWLAWTDGLWTFPGARPLSEDHCPAPFPEELPRRCMRLFSFPGDTVLDPFVGSGTCGVVAMQTGRRFYGFDRSALYIEQSRERLAQALASFQRNGHLAVAQP